MLRVPISGVLFARHRYLWIVWQHLKHRPFADLVFLYLILRDHEQFQWADPKGPFILLLPHSLSGFAYCFWVLLSITLQVPMSFSLAFVHLVWEWNCSLCLLFAWLPFASVLGLWLILGTFCHLFHLDVNSLGTLQFHHALVPNFSSRTSQKKCVFQS